MNELIKEINEQCDQAFKVTNDGDYYTLFNLDVEITSGWEDDIDINRVDNNCPDSPENCNFVTRKQNTDNRRMRWDNKAGYFGVCYIKEQKNWHASCFTKELGKQYHIGLYDTPEEAALAYDRFLDQIGDNRCRNLPEPKQIPIAI